jgi:hypothetical protein
MNHFKDWAPSKLLHQKQHDKEGYKHPEKKAKFGFYQFHSLSFLISFLLNQQLNYGKMQATPASFP